MIMSLYLQPQYTVLSKSVCTHLLRVPSGRRPSQYLQADCLMLISYWLWWSSPQIEGASETAVTGKRCRPVVGDKNEVY